MVEICPSGRDEVNSENCDRAHDAEHQPLAHLVRTASADIAANPGLIVYRRAAEIARRADILLGHDLDEIRRCAGRLAVEPRDRRFLPIRETASLDRTLGRHGALPSGGIGLVRFDMRAYARI